MQERDTIPARAKLAQLEPTNNDRLAMILQAALYLVSARNLLRTAGAKKATNKVRKALRSCDGAIRNRARFAAQEERSRA